MVFQYLITVFLGERLYLGVTFLEESVESGAQGNKTATTQLPDQVRWCPVSEPALMRHQPLKWAIVGRWNWRHRLAKQGIAGRARLTSRIIRSHKEKLPSGHQVSLVHFFSALFSLGDFFPSSMGPRRGIYVFCVYNSSSAFLV